MKLNQALDILLAALVVELREDGTDEEICSFTKQPGEAVSLDYAECGGMAWVRFVGAVPSISGFAPDVTATSCFWNLSHTVEMGVMRKAPIADDILNTVDLPDEAELNAASDKIVNDMSAMARAIKRAQREGVELLPGGYTPVGPIGGTVGGTWALTVAEE